jgi:hypothetical protein
VDLDEPVQGLQELLMADLSGAALHKTKRQRMSVSVLTAMSVKDSLEAIENVYTTSELLLLDYGCCYVEEALLNTTSYILGDYEV